MTEVKKLIVIIESDPRHIEDARQYFTKRKETETLDECTENALCHERIRGALDYLVLDGMGKVWDAIIDNRPPEYCTGRYRGTKPNVFGVILSNLPSHDRPWKGTEDRQDKGINCAELVRHFWKAGTPFVLTTDLSSEIYHTSEKVTRTDNYVRELAEDCGAEFIYGKDSASPPEKDWRLAFETLRVQSDIKYGLLADRDGRLTTVHLGHENYDKHTEPQKNARVLITGGPNHDPHFVIALKDHSYPRGYEPFCTPV